MLTIHTVDTLEAIALFSDSPPPDDLSPAECEAYCRERGLVALVAEEGAMLAGFAVAESNAQAVHFIALEGGTDACRVLLHRLVRLAGERDVCGWCPAYRRDIQGMLRRLGFTRRQAGSCAGKPAHFYHWSRNEDVRP